MEWARVANCYDIQLELCSEKKSVGQNPGRPGGNCRCLATRLHEILLMLFLECKFDKPTHKFSKFQAKLMSNKFLTRNWISTQTLRPTLYLMIENTFSKKKNCEKIMPKSCFFKFSCVIQVSRFTCMWCKQKTTTISLIFFSSTRLKLFNS